MGVQTQSQTNLKEQSKPCPGDVLSKGADGNLYTQVWSIEEDRYTVLILL